MNAWLLALLMMGPAAGPKDPPRSASAAPVERYQIELRVIEGVAGDNSHQVVDAELSALASDLKALPFSRVLLKDKQRSVIGLGERVAIEVPGAKKGKRQFLQVAAHGRQTGGKLRFQLSLESQKFDTLVAVPEGGTVVVAMPKKKGNAVLLAFTARTLR